MARGCPAFEELQAGDLDRRQSITTNGQSADCRKPIQREKMFTSEANTPKRFGAHYTSSIGMRNKKTVRGEAHARRRRTRYADGKSRTTGPVSRRLSYRLGMQPQSIFQPSWNKTERRTGNETENNNMFKAQATEHRTYT